MRPRVDLQRFSRCAGRGDLVNYVPLEEGIASGRAAERVFRRPAAAEDDMKTAILSTENAQGARTRASRGRAYSNNPMPDDESCQRGAGIAGVPTGGILPQWRARRFDCNPYRNYECLSGIWAEGVFDKVVADHGTVMWPNGADLCPDEVYDLSVKIGTTP